MLGRRLGQGKVFLSLFQDERWGGLCSYLGINQLREDATADVVFWRKGESIH